MTDTDTEFGGLTALFINTTLTRSPAASHTQLLVDASASIMAKQGVAVDQFRAVDHPIASGVYPDMREHGWEVDAWPELFPRVLAADILVIAGPIWLGDNSSETKKVIERLYAHSGELNERGQWLYYGRVGGCLITGNEDGIKHCASNVLYSLHPGEDVPDRTAARRPQRAELEIAARQGVEPARTELARVVREAAVAATDPDGFVDLLRGCGYLVELRRLPSADPIGFKIARNAATPVWFSGGRLAPDLSMPKLITRWDRRRNATERPAAEPRQTLKRAERVVRAARRGIATENPDGIAHAVGDVVAALGATHGGAWRDVARCYDRAARAPYEPAPRVGPIGSELRVLAGHLLRPRRRNGNELDVMSTVALLVALAALVQRVAEWRAEQGRQQAVAARSSARAVRRVAVDHQPRPPVPQSSRVQEAAPVAQ